MGTKKSGGIWNKMKVLYIGHYKEGSGWSNAAINNILALDSIGINVVCRDIKLTNNSADIPKRIEQLESKDLSNVDYCIQHVLPHHLVGSSKFKKNVAYFVHESSNIIHTNWYVNLKQMDEVWVPSLYAKNKLEEEGLETKVLPHCFDTHKYRTEYPKIDFQDVNSYFKFYTIADINDRKNVDSIIKCFYSEFSNHEPVCLVLKLKKYGMGESELSSYISTKINEIKKNMRMYKNSSSYPKQVVITSNMTNDQIYSLHQTCDCFVGISHGEGWSIPAFEAMCFGNTPICSNEGGPSEFIDPENKSTGCLIDGTYGVCNHSNPAFSNIFTGNEEWFIPSESETKRAMRFYYESRSDINRTDGIKRAKSFTFEKVANMIKGYLND